MQIEQFENANERMELLPQIAERIFAICRSDSMFCKNKIQSKNYVAEVTQKNE